MSLSTPLADTALAGALLRPDSIALIGVSDDPAKTAGRPLQYLRQTGFSGRIYCVNPTRDTVQGEPAYARVSELPEVVDHAFILTGTALAMEAVAECGRTGIPLATMLATGFSESGSDGLQREAQLRAITQETGIRILGPSSLGVVNVAKPLRLTANAAFAEPALPRGGIFCASHSGSLIGALVSRGLARGIGFNSLVSVGSEVDLSIGEICAATLEDPDITGYLLFLESTRHAQQLRAFAIAAAERGKPVFAYKLGRSAAAAELAVSHTGALAGEDDVADIFLKESGIARVETFEGLLEALPLLRRVPLNGMPAQPHVGVVTTTGGGAAMAVDQLGIRGVAVSAPSETTLQRLAEADIEVSGGRIIDLTLAGTRYPVMKRTLDIMLDAPEFDLVLAVVGSSARSQPELAVKPVIDSATAGKALACFLVPEAPEALQRLGAAGIPAFRTPETCGDVIAATFGRRYRPTPPAPPLSGHGRPIDEEQAYRLLARVGIHYAPTAVIDVDQTDIALPFAFPVAVKVLSAEIGHKTDIGGVILGVEDEPGLRAAIARIQRDVAAHRPDVAMERVLVQPMQEGVGEVLIGLRHDPEVGPLVLLAAGGVLTEIYRDRSLRLAPVDLETARAMIREVKSTATLSGYRGRAAGDLDAVARTIVAMSELATLPDTQVLEAEINPLKVGRKGEGAIAVDALVRLA